MKITSLHSHVSKIYAETQYDFLSMRTKRNPHCPSISGETRKEELTKRLCSLVDNNQDSCKKVPFAKESSHRLGAGGRSMGMRREREGQKVADSGQRT